MPEPDNYDFCNNDLEVHAGDRTRKHNWFGDLFTSEGLCTWSVCGVGDVRAWFAAANTYITGGHSNSFKQHFSRYKKSIQMQQGAASVEQNQVIEEAQKVLDEWANYAKHFRTGGGGPVGSSFQTGGYSWETSEDADPGGPENLDFLAGNTVFDLCVEIVDWYYGPASCLRNKFNLTKPDGMLGEAPGYGGVTKRPPSEDSSGGGLGVMEIGMMGLGAWVLLKALSE